MVTLVSSKPLRGTRFDGSGGDEFIFSFNLARSLMTGAASLALMVMAPAVVRAETVIGSDGADAMDGVNPGDPDLPAGDGEPAIANDNPATAIGGNGGAGGDISDNSDGGNGGAARRPGLRQSFRVTLRHPPARREARAETPSPRFFRSQAAMAGRVVTPTPAAAQRRLARGM